MACEFPVFVSMASDIVKAYVSFYTQPQMAIDTVRTQLGDEARWYRRYAFLFCLAFGRDEPLIYCIFGCIHYVAGTWFLFDVREP